MEKALKVMQEAVETLSSPIGDTKSLLKKAFAAICLLELSQFPEDLRPDFAALLIEAGCEPKGAWTTDRAPCDGMGVRLDKIENGEAVSLQVHTLTLANKLETHTARP